MSGKSVRREEEDPAFLMEKKQVLWYTNKYPVGEEGGLRIRGMMNQQMESRRDENKYTDKEICPILPQVSGDYDNGFILRCTYNGV